MNNTILSGYGPQLWGAGTGTRPAQTGAKSSSFLQMAQQASQTARAAAPQTDQVEAASLETMLKSRYPGLVYHVFDASSGYWKSRNDYPHYLLYQEGDRAKETLENWEPSGPNPFYGSIDGRFTAPQAIRALGSVPPGSKAVVIHPAVQARMEQDPAYAREIFDRIDTWFTFDVLRNEAIRPGSTFDMAQAVAIGEDGNICNACASSPGGEITYSQSGSTRVRSWWDLRMARHAEFMQLLIRERIEDRIQASGLSDAKARLSSLLRAGNLQTVLGSTLAGTPTETVLALTQQEIWGGSFL